MSVYQKLYFELRAQVRHREGPGAPAPEVGGWGFARPEGTLPGKCPVGLLGRFSGVLGLMERSPF